MKKITITPLLLALLISSGAYSQTLDDINKNKKMSLHPRAAANKDYTEQGYIMSKELKEGTALPKAPTADEVLKRVASTKVRLVYLLTEGLYANTGAPYVEPVIITPVIEAIAAKNGMTPEAFYRYISSNDVRTSNPLSRGYSTTSALMSLAQAMGDSHTAEAQALKSTILAMIKVHEQAAADISKLTEENAKLVTSNDALKAVNLELEKAISKYITDITTLVQKNKDLQSALESKMTENLKLKQDSLASSDQVKALTAKIDALTKELATKQAEIALKDLAVASLESQKAALSSTISSLNSKVTSLESDLAAAKAATKTVEVVKEVIKEVPVEVVKTVEVIKEVPVTKTVEVIKEVPVEVIKTVEVVKEVIKEVPSGVKTVEVIKEVPVEVIKTVEVIKEVPVEVIKTVEVIKEVPVEVIKTVTVTDNAKITELETELSASKKALLDATIAWEAKELQLSNLLKASGDKVTELTTKNADLEAMTVVLNSKISTLTAEKAALQAKVDELSKVTSSDSEIADLKNQLEASKTALNTWVTAHDAHTATDQATIKEAVTYLNTASTKYTAYGQAAGNYVFTEGGDVSVNLAVLVSAMKAQIEYRDTLISQLTSRVTTLNSEKSSLTAQLATMTVNYNTATSRVSTLENKIDAFHSEGYNVPAVEGDTAQATTSTQDAATQKTQTFKSSSGSTIATVTLGAKYTSAAQITDLVSVFNSGYTAGYSAGWSAGYIKGWNDRGARITK